MKKLRLFDSLKFVVAAIVCTFILNVAHAATLPAGYTELEYLESTAMPSRAYINTGLNFNSNYIYEINFLQSNVHNWIMGAAIEAYNKKGVFVLTYCSDSTCFYSSTKSAAGYSILTLPNNVRHTAKYQQSTKTALLDDRNVWSNSWITDENIPYNIFLFGYNIAGNVGGGRSGYLRIYSYRVKDADGVLIQNFIPARRDSDGMLGMYDLADSNPETAFHTNAGTGTFIAGEYSIKIATTRYNEESFAPVKTDLSAAMNAVDDVVSRTMSQAQAIDTIATTKQTRPDEGCTAKYCLLVEDEDGTPHWYPIAGANGVEYVLPAGYTQLEYLQSDGRCRIIVPYRVNNKTVFYARYSLTSRQTVGVIFGVTDSVSAGIAMNGILRMVGNYNRMGWGNNVSGSVIDVNAPQNLDTWYEVLYDQNKLYQDNVLYATSATSNDTEWVANYDLGIFARNGAAGVDFYPAIAKISSVWAKENGVYKINLVPARRDSDGVLGMYDLADANPATAFHTNAAGMGTFTAGPDM